MAQITDNARARNAPAVAEAAGRLAEESGRQGQREVALVSRTIATDAGRGILSQPRLMQLVMLTSSVG
jgi:hypothetical protein